MRLLDACSLKPGAAFQMSEPYQHRARKRFGQNFLHDAGVIHRILRAIHAREGEHLLEIGPGQGALTCLLYTSPSPRDLSTSRMPSSA